jgi:hypothetical protein
MGKKMDRNEREEFYTNLTDHVLLSDSTKVMEIMENVVHDPEVNVFDRATLVRELTEAWQAARDDVVIPPNPENAPYVLVNIANPTRQYAFFLDREQAIAMRNANARTGVATRVIDCETAKVVVE